MLIGIAVTFELAGGIISENTANPETNDIPKEGSLLVCTFSQLSTSSQLQLLTKQELRILESADEYNIILIFGKFVQRIGLMMI